MKNIKLTRGEFTLVDDDDYDELSKHKWFCSKSKYGKKYALGNLFLIDDTQDSDATNDHGKKSNVVNKLKEKAKPSIPAEAFKTAKEYISAGGNLDAIKTKYKLTVKQEKELNGQKAKTENTKETS